MTAAAPTRIDVHVESAASALEPVTAVVLDGGNLADTVEDRVRDLELLLDWGPRPGSPDKDGRLPRLALLSHSRLPDGTTVITGAVSSRQARCLCNAPEAARSRSGEAPILLWGNEVWADGAAESGPGAPTPSFSAEALQQFAAEHRAELAVFLTDIRDLHRSPAGRQLVISASEQEVAWWIALASGSLPARLGNSLTFVTWARNPWRMPQQIIGVDAESEFDPSQPTLGHYFRLHGIEDAPRMVDPWAALVARAWLSGRPDVIHSGPPEVEGFFDVALITERLLRAGVELPEDEVSAWAASWIGQPDRLARLPLETLDRVVAQLAAETTTGTTEQEDAERVRLCRRLIELRTPETVAPLSEALTRRWLDTVLERPTSTSLPSAPDLRLPPTVRERVQAEYVGRFVGILLDPRSPDELTQLCIRARQVGASFAAAVLTELDGRLDRPRDHDRVVAFAGTPAGDWLDGGEVPRRLRVVRRFVLSHGHGKDRPGLFHTLVHSFPGDGADNREVARLAWRLVWPHSAISEQDAAAVATRMPAALLVEADLTGPLAAVLDSPDPVRLDRCALAKALLREDPAFPLTEQQRARARLLVTAHELATGHFPAQGAAEALAQQQKAAGAEDGELAYFCREMLAVSLYMGDRPGYRDRSCLRALALGNDPELLHRVHQFHQERREREKLLTELRTKPRRWVSLFVVIAENQESGNDDWRRLSDAFDRDLLEPAYRRWDASLIAQATEELACYGPDFVESWDGWRTDAELRSSGRPFFRRGRS